MVEPYRVDYRAEMNCQVLHDSLHARPGWVEWYKLDISGGMAGYGAVAVGGPWREAHALFEVYVTPKYRRVLFPLAAQLVAESQAVQIVGQTNDRTFVLLLHQLCRDFEADKLVFARGSDSNIENPGVLFRRNTASDESRMFIHSREPVGDWVLELGHEIVATGGYLRHYNPPYVDIYMEVRDDVRRRGFGSYLVQQIGRQAVESGMIPCARCDIDNTASAKTLSRAGFVPCAHRIAGRIV
jgi:GNAT superfamily N-acetyltransferase